MDDGLNFPTPPSVSVIHSEISTSQFAELSTKICPLCSSEIRFFFISFNEKLLMCENTHCDYPFGYENLQFVRIDTYDDLSDQFSIKTKKSPSPPSCSSISAAAWSDIDKINRIYDSEDSQIPEGGLSYLLPKTKRNKSSYMDSEEKIKKHMEDIKGLNMELQDIKAPSRILSNEKWINKLKTLQDKSGVELLRPQELKRVKQGTKELKIDIETDSGDMSVIKIQITDPNNT